ncbi:UDP-glycosyltransferase 83A1 [Citrus sinensis]|uniref:UDP-glycosyltransferase 83A1 n=1 Tax=Citrus sinensis TaxID=2711 RepID=A0ACB8LXP3_CITSI|nr:UDP-glycosyltransferase 83A1 [Citrus sinensis]
MATCFIAHATIAWALDTAKKMGVKMAMFWPSAVAAFALSLTDAKITDHNGVPLKSGMIKISPKLPAMSTDEFIWSVPGDPIRRKILFGYISCAKKTLKICNWLLCSSFYELEPLACDSIPNVLPIGPLLWINRPGKAAASLWPEDSTCLKWLDKQPSQSVIYVAFGSIAIFSRCQFEEVALGLELAGRPFLWVVRPNLLDGSVIKYPDGFLERVPNQGMIIEWAPQEQVLAHRAVACFLSHCGWNSTIEGLSSAVPFLCWPYFADQFLISSYICDFWKHLAYTVKTCYVANPKLRPQRPSGNWHTRIDNSKKSEVLPSDTPQPLDTPRPGPSVTKQIADAGSPVVLPTENRANTTNSTSIQEPIGQDATTHVSRVREPGEYPHLHRASITDFRHYNSHTDNDDSSDEHLANNDHFLSAPENYERIDSSPDYSVVSYSIKGIKLINAKKIGHNNLRGSA